MKYRLHKINRYLINSSKIEVNYLTETRIGARSDQTTHQVLHAFQNNLLYKRFNLPNNLQKLSKVLMSKNNFWIAD
jgi:hypothetical protein